MSEDRKNNVPTIAQDQSKETEFFDQFTQDKEYDVLGEYGYSVLIKAFKELIGPERLTSECRVVDLGCGTGSVTRRFAKNVEAKCYGVDISENSIKVAQSKNDGIEYSVGDIAKLNFEDNSFDVVLFSGVLHHFQDFSFCLKEAYRILKPGGCVVAFDPHIKNPAMWLYRDPKSPFFSNLGKTDNEQLLSGDQVEGVLNECGYSKTHSHAVGGVTFKYVESKFGRLLLPVYNACEYLFGLLPWARTRGSFLICYAQKD